MSSPVSILVQEHSEGKAFCFGMGYVGGRFIRAFQQAGFGDGAGAVRSAEKRDACRAEGVIAWTFSEIHEEFLNDVSHVLLSVPPDNDGDAIIRSYAGILTRLPKLRWCAYLSSTGVYGDHGGAWVDEMTAPAPASEEGKRRLRAEAQWRSLDLPLHIFRLSGIYGPGRNMLRQVRAGQAKRIVKPGHTVSRIHVDDIVRLLLASAARPQPGSLYNLADNEPAPTSEVVEYAASLLGCEPPPVVPYGPDAVSPEARRFYEVNRRISNRKALKELNIALEYPDYRAGLRALHAEDAA